MADIRTDWVDNIGMSEDAAYLNAVGTAINNNTHATTLSGTWASMPAAATSNTGAHYFCTDCDAVYKSDGSAWTKIRCSGLAVSTLADPPTSWTTNTLGSTTIVTEADGRLMTVPSVAGDNVRMEYMTLSPSSNYTCTVLIVPNLTSAGNCHTGIALYESGSGKIVTFGWANISGWNLYVEKYTNATTFSAHGGNASMGVSLTATRLTGGYPLMLRIRDDGTNRNYEFSYNGYDWFAAISAVSRTDFITPDKIGWYGYNSSGVNTTYRLRSWKLA